MAIEGTTEAVRERAEEERKKESPRRESPKPTGHLKRYAEIARLFFKHGLADLMDQDPEIDELLDERPAAAHDDGAPEELADDLEALGPTFVKLGQLLSTRADLLPLPYLEALSRLQDSVSPVPYAEIEEIVAEELGVRISKAFSEFEAEPVASASLGQVHRAALRDGRRVAVKVQRPGIRGQIVEDFEALARIAALLDRWPGMGRQVDFTRTLEEMRRTVLEELDYTLEARNLERLGKNLAAFELIEVPRPIADYTTTRVLTMELVSGRKVTDLSPLARLELDGRRLGEELFRAYLHQILADGFFHADPHPGNVFVTDEGRLALIDLGMTARLSPEMRERLLKLTLAIAEAKADDAADEAIAMGHALDDFDEEDFRRRVATLVVGLQDTTAGRIELGKVMLEVSRIAGRCGMRLPPELTMLGKTLLNLDQIAVFLDPDLDPNALVRKYSGEIARRQMLEAFSPSHLISKAVEMKELVEELPGRLNRILDSVARDGFRINVDALDENLLVEGFQKVANRITAGLLLTGLVLGASLLMRVPTGFILFGYPGLPIILFIASALGAVLLVGKILLEDRARKRRR